MGLGFLIHAVPRSRGWLQPKPEADALWDETEAFFRREVCDPILARLMRFSRPADGQSLRLQLHPAEEFVSFDWKGAQVQVRARTTSTGPGYHAWLCGLLERWAGELKTNLVVNPNPQTDEDPYDETGYLLDHDFAGLRAEMLSWLQGVAKVFVNDMEGYQNLSFSMPMEFRPQVPDAFVLTQLGPRSRAWFAGLQDAAGNDALAPYGREHFCWWEEGMTAPFYAQLGRLLLWMDVPWRPAANTTESLVMDCALMAFDRARQLDPAIAIPEQELHELRYILGLPKDEAYVPAPNGIGYHRHPVDFSLPGQWTVELPGYYLNGSDNDGETTVLTYGNRTVRGTAWTIKSKDGEEPSAGEVLIAPKEGKDVIPYEGGFQQGWAQIATPWETEQDQWVLTGHMAVRGRMCLLLVFFEREEDSDWAVSVWKSVSHPDPDVE